MYKTLSNAYYSVESYKIKSNSQLKQDLHVINYYKGKKNGFYIELGAHDGIHISNTLLLENKYDWTGILIEPSNTTFKELVKNRPNNINVNSAVYSVDGKKVIFEEKVESTVSGIKTDLSGQFKDSDKRSEYEKITKTLTTILDENNAPSFIDYLSLDTEGSELEILKGIDFSKYKIGYIDVEHNYKQPRRRDIKKLLISNGYTYLGKNKWDDVYVLKK
tara:strand:- start:754 stop:1410 length:657 start_codon:yes stop_codon:yes gene_type:complete